MAAGGGGRGGIPVCGTKASLPTGDAWWFGFVVQAFTPHAAASTSGGKRERESVQQLTGRRDGRGKARVFDRGVDPPPACNWGAPLDDGRGRSRRGRGCRGGGRRWQAQVGAHSLDGFRVCEIHGELFLTTRSRNGSLVEAELLLLLVVAAGSRRSPQDLGKSPLVGKNGLEGRVR